MSKMQESTDEWSDCDGDWGGDYSVIANKTFIFELCEHSFEL